MYSGHEKKRSPVQSRQSLTTVRVHPAQNDYVILYTDNVGVENFISMKLILQCLHT